MIHIRNLQKHYGDFSLDCTLDVLPGRITGLIGQNGAGKSTTFKAILGLIHPDGGTVTVLGKDVRALTAADKEQLGVVLSDSGFSGYLTVRDILPILRHMFKAFDEDFFTEHVKRFELPLNKKIKDFSTGMKAKLKLLVALSHHARLLILDEPTAGLDVIARDDLLLLLREYMEQNGDCATLISSHISSDLETLCDDLYMIHGGRIILHADTDVLLSDYAILKVSPEQYAAMDKAYILRARREPFGYSLLTDQRRFYAENEPAISSERGSVDGVITLLIKGETV